MARALLALLIVVMTVEPVIAGAEDDARTVFERFVAAQNAHDASAVGELLWDSPNFLWITRGTAIRGRQPALARFQALYQGTWLLEPMLSELTVTLLGEGVAEIYVPIVFTIGAPGQNAQKARFLMNQVLVRTPSGWKIASILPIPAPPP